jgi:hypothetical protein
MPQNRTFQDLVMAVEAADEDDGFEDLPDEDDDDEMGDGYIDLTDDGSPDSLFDPPDSADEEPE